MIRDISHQMLDETFRMKVEGYCCNGKMLAALRDEYWQVRFTVVNALRDIDNTRAIEPIRQLLDDKSKHVVAMVNHALVALKVKS